MYNLLIACDQPYYNQWGENCLKSLKHHVPWLNLHTIVVNPENNFKKLKNVNYYFDETKFDNENSKIGYLQSVRFIKCSEIFPNRELVMSIDCDTLCSKSFSKEEFKKVCETIHVQRHQKDIRWMAGLVTYGNTNDFRIELKEMLLSIPVSQWKHGWDQEILKILSSKYKFNPLAVGNWMSFGRGRGIFLTLKGDQKISPGYLENYNNVLRTIK